MRAKARPAVRPAIEAILNLFSKRTRDMDVIDKAIDSLHQSDDEIERRLQALRTQVEVYQRALGKETTDG